jgi:hypothetical protein
VYKFLMFPDLLVTFPVTFLPRFWRPRASRRRVQRGGLDAAASTRSATSTDFPGAGKQGPKTCIKTVKTGPENLYKNGKEDPKPSIKKGARKKRTRNPL